MNKKLIISVIGGIVAWLAIIKHPYAPEGESPLQRLLTGNFSGFLNDMRLCLTGIDVPANNEFHPETLIRTYVALIVIVLIVWYINKKMK